MVSACDANGEDRLWVDVDWPGQEAVNFWS